MVFIYLFLLVKGFTPIRIVEVVGKIVLENVNSQVEQSTPIAEVWRSFRNIRPLHRYSPTLNYLLLTDGGELVL